MKPNGPIQAWGRAMLVGILAVAGMFLGGCEDDDRGDGGGGTGENKGNLGIPDRYWAPGHDDVGWCGETCIQMAMGYYGSEVSQEAINAAAGSPADITESDMDKALRGMGVEYEAWNESNQDVNQFVAWADSHLRQGRPVICGTKIYPDETPAWYVDHFVLAVGYMSDSLLLNTQWDCDGPLWISHAQLTSMEEGYAFQNRYQRYFGRAIYGVR